MDQIIYEILSTLPIKIWHNQLTWDPKDTEDTKGVPMSLFHFSRKPLQYGCLWISLDPSNQELTFWADSGPNRCWTHEGVLRSLLQLCQKNQTPLDLNIHDVTFWADLRPPRTLRVCGHSDLDHTWIHTQPWVMTLAPNWHWDLPLHLQCNGIF